jgi:hypothetical protein
MTLLGLLVLIGVAGLTLAVIWANDGVFAAPAGAIELFGNQMNPTVGQLFLGGAAAGALVLLGMFLIFRGLGRNARHRPGGRHQLNDPRHELPELPRKHGTVSSGVATHRAANDGATDSGWATAGR